MEIARDAKLNNETIKDHMDKDVNKLYRKNLQNMIYKSVDKEKYTKNHEKMFGVSEENKAMKISQSDVDMLKRYEKLLFSQNKRCLLQLKT